MYGRVRSTSESKAMDGGFRWGSRCVDQAFTIRQLSKKVLEKNSQTVVACTHLEKVYDKVCAERDWQALDEYGAKAEMVC